MIEGWLFDEDEWEEREFTFEAPGGVPVRQKCLGWRQGGCDVIWSDVMGYWLSKHSELFKGRTVMELGAGCGLMGNAAGQVAERVCITDGDPREVPLVQKNVEQYSTVRADGTRVSEAFHLEWGLKEAKESQLAGDAAAFDVVMGQQICHFPHYLGHLAETIRYFLKPNGTAYICNEAVSTSTTQAENMRIWVAALEEKGLVYERIPLDTFLPSGMERPSFSWMMRITHKK